eukprot:CAMPEP_0201722542 /NCGR_PEP_ID=MMETSP0593-20130828/6895_1 /ASSEMBLY_ACC=CAM_ASM_000672 /TAXON_ID=267983 /ORGANISM="Skeletonema japonicum, Strain CCMP2506" /LENGTH=331 /DNA_ID=CAMNT_0048213519 /DNA_START=146 /DNA_END=1141 /DNA_ORIENTATION=+
MPSLPFQTKRCKATHLQAATLSSSMDNKQLFPSRKERGFFELKTLIRVLFPAIISGAIAYATLPTLNNQIASFVLKVSDPGKISMLGDAVQSFISLVGLLYSILVGQVFGFLYSQQEALYLALFDEVTEAKSLLEQVALVSQGRTMYSTCLNSIARYVKNDLLEGMESFDGSITPSLLLSARPSDDPLEAILYLTSVGVPGHVYDTVRSLRQARSRRLGALQRKVPVIHLIMLWLLGIVMVGSFPVFLGVSEAAAAMGGLISRSNMTVQSGLFGVATFSVVMCKSVLMELWRTKGGAYNVDKTLKVMVSGLKKELDERMAEAKKIMKRSKQ